MCANHTTMLVADHPVVRIAIRFLLNLLQHAAGAKVIIVDGSEADVRQLIEQVKPYMVLYNIDMLYSEVGTLSGASDSAVGFAHDNLTCKLEYRPTDLTSRQQDVLRGVIEGKTNYSIAHNLSISEKTVEKHVGEILRRFQAGNRVEAAVMAVREGVI